MSQNLKCKELRTAQAATQTSHPGHHSRMPRICNARGDRGCLNSRGWKRKSYLMSPSSCPSVLEVMQNFVQGSVFCLGKIPGHSITEGLQEQSWHAAGVTGGARAYSETLHDPTRPQSKGAQIHQSEHIHFLLLFLFFFKIRQSR